MCAHRRTATRISAPRTMQAISLTGRTDYGSRPWIVAVKGGGSYVVKWADLSQDGSQAVSRDAPHKMLLSELLCGRLGQLFTPTLTPHTGIIRVPKRLGEGRTHEQKTALQPPAGLWVGIRYIDGHPYDWQRWHELISLQRVNPFTRARLAIFQLWLNALDPELMVAAEDDQLYSIDHDRYFTGLAWNRDLLQRLADDFSLARLPLFYRYLADGVKEEALQDAVDELGRLPEDMIIAQFRGIPPEWGVADGLAEMLKSFLVRRRGALTQCSGGVVKAAMSDAGVGM